MAFFVVLCFEYTGQEFKKFGTAEGTSDLFGEEELSKDDFVLYKRYLFLIYAAWTFLSMAISGAERSLFGVMGERLSYRLRLDLLQGVLYKQISWFDREERAPGILTNIMAENITELNGMSTELFVTIVEVIFSLTFSCAFGIFLCWQQGILCLLLSPIAIGAGVASARLHFGRKGGKRKGEQAVVDEYEKSNALLSDVILNYRTLVSFGQNNVNAITERFTELLIEP